MVINVEDQKNKGLLIVISGFSGAGKGTVVKKLLERDTYSLSISATTREPRAGEEHGKSYFFISEEEFLQQIDNDRFLEWANYCDHYYGTPIEYVDEQINQGFDVVLEIEVQGALKIKEQIPDAVLLFIVPPTVAELKQRLLNRGTESIEIVNKRVQRASEEVEDMGKYDYILINDQVKDCVMDIHHIVESEHKKASRSQDLIKKFHEQFQKFDNN